MIKLGTALKKYDPLFAAAQKARTGYKAPGSSGSGLNWGKIKQGVKDFFGNPEMEVPYKIKDDWLINRLTKSTTGRDPKLMKITGPGAEEVRDYVERQMVKGLGPEVVPTGPMGSHTKVRDIMNSYMKEKKIPGLSDVEKFNMRGQRFSGPDDVLLGNVMYKSKMSDALRKFKPGDAPKQPQIVEEILRGDTSKRGLKGLHPDLLAHDTRFTPQQKEEIAEAIRSGVIDLKGGSKQIDSFRMPVESKDRINARRILGLFSKDYGWKTPYQQAFGGKHKSSKETLDKLENVAKGGRYLRNTAIAASPGVAGYYALRDDEG